MKIEWLENGYTNHGCKIFPTANKRLGMVNYYAEVKNREFNSANRHDGLFDYKDKAEALVKSECSGVQIRLHIPDLVFQCDRP